MRRYIKPSMTIIDLTSEIPFICASSPEINVKPGKADEDITPMSNRWKGQVPWDESDDE